MYIVRWTCGSRALQRRLPTSLGKANSLCLTSVAHTASSPATLLFYEIDNRTVNRTFNHVLMNKNEPILVKTEPNLTKLKNKVGVGVTKKEEPRNDVF